MSQTGKIILAKRLEKNWNQEELSRGICAVSYLSKIEKGKAEPSEEILAKLLDRLGVELDEEKEKQGEDLCEKGYEYLFSAMNQELRGLMEDIDPAVYEDTRRASDLKILKQLAAGETEQVSSLPVNGMDERQRAVVLTMRGECEEAVRLYPDAWICLMAGIDAYEKKDIRLALRYLETAWNKACAEGKVRVMLSASLYQFHSASYIRDEIRMAEAGNRARHIAAGLSERNTLFMIEYNMALNALAYGPYEEARVFFASLKKPNSLSLLFAAAAYERCGEKEKALSVLAEARHNTDPLSRHDTVKKCLELVSYRLHHADYINEKEYGELLCECVQCNQENPLSGMEILLVQDQLAWYQASRQYKKAYGLLKEYPHVQKK